MNRILPSYPDLKTPVYVCELKKLRHNVRILNRVQQEAGCKILLALKGFAMWSVFPVVKGHLHGVAASSLHEARLGREEFAREVHVYSPAYRDDEFAQIEDLADHIVFNSVPQWKRFRELAPQTSSRQIHYGIRVNPEHSEVKTPLYDPCAPASRLGATISALDGHSLDGLSGIHFHTLCEMNSDALDRTAAAVESRFAELLPRMSWINFGGGHHITRDDYDAERLVSICRRFRNRYGLEVYLEPGGAIALNAGVLVASVLDIVTNGIQIAILDTSATAHMPDVLEMPYRPDVEGAGPPQRYPHTYRLTGITCLAGDVIGDYSFPKPLQIGQRLVFSDMAQYTMVKNTTFNGVRLPSIATFDPDTGKIDMVREFGYDDYKRRLS